MELERQSHGTHYDLKNELRLIRAWLEGADNAINCVPPGTKYGHRQALILIVLNDLDKF